MAMSSAVQEDRGGRTFRGKVLTVGILMAIFVLAMVIRCVWYYGPAVAPAGAYGDYHYVLSGNDPDYHKRAIDYAVATGHALAWDPLMNYPVGGPNPNPPAFAWSSMFIGYALSPFFNFDVNEAVWMFFQVVPAFWAAMTIFPIYFFTRDMFGRKPAYIASFIIAVMAGNVERTPLGFSDHDSFVVFFVVTGFFFLMRALKNLDEKTRVRSWGSARDISTGMMAFLQGNKISIIYSVMAGFCIAAVMLAWKGVAYIFAILTMYLIVHVLIKRFRKEDPLGISMCVLLAGGVGLLVAFPYYYSMSFIMWYETPFFVYVAMGLFAAIMVPTRDQPYLIIIAVLAAIVAAGFAVVYYYFPALYNVLLGFQGYFIHDKLYQTIAEAQPPDFSRMVYSYGEYIFYFGLIAVFYQAYRLPKERFRNDYIFGIAWFAMAIYMAMSAVRFMYNATPVFAILGGWVTWVIISLLDFKKMVKTYRGLSGGGRWHAIKSSVKVRHVAGAFFIGYMVLASTAFYGLDAGIPYETKKEFDKDIYNFLPAQLRPAKYDVSGSSLWWFGSFGTAFPSDYWTDAMFWFQTQDTNFTDEDRPAFVAWWDYGHWCMHMGHHPSIADNFQQGVQISGNIITAQSENEVEALFIARTVEGNETSSQVVPILEKYLGKEATKDFQDIEGMVDIPRWRAEVLAHPAIYGNRTSDINDLNVKWAALAGLLTSRLSEEQLVEMYNEITKATDREIRYFAADSRMFPFAATNTGIYYAPVKLSDQDYNQFLKITAVGNDGQEYDPNHFPESVRQDKTFKITQYKLYYLEPFYNSLFYKAYVGYGPEDVGLSATDGIPSMIGTMRTGQYPPMQGWNLSNFRLEYRTAYWSPYNESTGLSNHTDSWGVVPPWTSEKYQNQSEGTVDLFYRNLFQGGVFMLKYYHGAIVSGTVTTDKGAPVPNARVTVYDDLPLAISYYPGVPHGCTFTDAKGRYNILAPYGNVTVMVTNGGQESADDLLLVKEKRVLGSAEFYVSDEQAMRHNIDLNTDGIMDFNIRQDFTVNTGNLSGRAYYDMDNTGAYGADADVPLSGTITAVNATIGTSYEATLDSDGNYSMSNMTPADYSLTVDFERIDVDGGLAGVDAGLNASQDVRLVNINVAGNVSFENGTPAQNVSVGVLSASGEVLWANSSLDNGSYAVERLLPGNYSVSLVGGGFLAENAAIMVNQSQNITLNLTAIPVHDVTGTVSISAGGRPAPGAVVSFQNLDNSSRSVAVVAGAGGAFRAGLAPGNYTVYAVSPGASSRVSVSLSSLTIDSMAGHLDISLNDGLRLNGTVFRDYNENGTFDPGLPNLTEEAVTTPEYQPGATVEVEFQEGRLYLPCNILGQYETILPAGQYVLRAQKDASETEPYVNVTPLNLSAPLQLNLSLSKGVQVSGTVFWDRNGNDVVDAGEEAAGATILFGEKKRPEHTVVAVTAANGTFNLSLLQVTEYGVQLTAPGYNGTSESLSTGVDPVSRNFKLVPVPALVDIMLEAGGAPAPSGLKVNVSTFSEGAKGAELVTGAGGRISGYFMPGQYAVTVGQNLSTALGTENFSMTQTLDVSVGQPRLNLSFSLDCRFYLSGAVFYDENLDGIPQRAEYRNSLVKFVPESEMGNVEASVAGIPSLSTVVSQNTLEGRYEVALSPGNYTAWSLLELPTPEGPPLVFLMHVYVDRSLTLNMSLEPGCKVRSLAYTDLNDNGLYDSGEQRSGVPVAFKDSGTVILTVGSDPSGYFELTLPQGGSYSLTVQNTTNETLSEQEYVPIRYIAAAELEVPRQGTAESNLTMARQIQTVGRVSYDRNADGGPGADERVPGIGVVFTAPGGNRSVAVTNSTGDFDTYLESKLYNMSVDAPGFNSSIAELKSAEVSLERRVFNFSLEAVNTTLSLDVRLDGRPARLPGGAAVTLQALDGRAVNASGQTDVGGLLQLSLRPGIYSLYVTGVRDGAQFAYIGPLDIEPSGAPVGAAADLVRATRLWGSASMVSAQGGRAAPDRVDMLFNTTMNVSGLNFTASLNFSGQNPVYQLYLPAANYSLSASFVRPEGEKNVTYNATTQADIATGAGDFHLDLILKKAMDYSLGLSWDETQKVTVPANSTANYTMRLSNFGNNRTTVDLEVSRPSGWSVDVSIEKVTLEEGENLTVLVNITVPEEASAGDNTITINASASEMPYPFFNSTPLTVNVIQHYGIGLKREAGEGSISEGGTVQSFTVTNTGNGEDTINLTVTGPYGWNLTLSDFNPVLTGGESKTLQVTAKPFSGARIEKGLSVRIRAVSRNELVPAQEITVNLTFPELSAGNFKVNGTGVSLVSQSIPGFTSAPALAGACIAAVAIAVIRRRSR
jgi:asparagine N-glycosylation enzyme membrane subunit Stt3